MSVLVVEAIKLESDAAGMQETRTVVGILDIV
jgi:hypothetical protein